MNTNYTRQNFRPQRKFEDPVRASLLVNEQIRHYEVRVIDFDGSPLGVMPTKQAIKTAKDQGCDLVEVTANAKPPVVKIVDINKHVYQIKRAKKEQDKKARENATVMKEIQLRPVTDKHDLEIKMNHAKDFLADDVKVKIVIKFKGRELNFANKGFDIMNSFLTGIGECRIEKPATMDGKSISAIVAPLPKNK